MYRTFLMLSVAAYLCFGATPQKTALDKPTLEAYIRHLMVYGNQIAIAIDDPKPSPLPGFVQFTVHASAGQAKQDLIFSVSKDG
jgi:hypothetical protein